jgi:hypothetical protein
MIVSKMNKERMMKKVVEIVLSQHFSGGTKENYKISIITHCAVRIDGLQTGI